MKRKTGIGILCNERERERGKRPPAGLTSLSVSGAWILIWESEKRREED